MCEQNDKCGRTSVYWFKGRSLPQYASVVTMAPFTADKLVPVIQKTGQNSVNGCLSKHRGFGPSCTGIDKVEEIGLQFDIAGLGAVSALLVNEAPAPVTQKAGGASSSGGQSKSGGSKDEKNSAASISGSCWAYSLIVASVAGSYLM